MGVPAFFRWLSRKYPSIVVNCVEQKAKVINGVIIPIDSSEPNPNDIEFDNLYLDMNGIIHPCCHPENKPAPKNEEEMMVAIFEYIDRLFAICRPRRLLYMAIDGVAPRAKMNQQRSRRFRASKESDEKSQLLSELREKLEGKGCNLPPLKEDKDRFDSNCITPGTEFMFRLSECLQYYIHDRLNSDPGWKNIEVILSDANVPGEGEHKIMDYIRHQRGQPDHDPNTQHCLCGADADLIMLGLATHEPHFTIIREEFKPNQPRPCELCSQYGHEMSECTGLARDASEFDSANQNPIGTEQTFIFIRLNVLREYLQRELVMTNITFTYDFERALDDWVFMCFFVGNDFLPHLPSLEIREGAIDRLVKLYKQTLHKTRGYIAENGIVNLSRVQVVLTELGKVEDEIFKSRRDRELNFRERSKRAGERNKRQKMDMTPLPQQTVITPRSLGLGPQGLRNPRQEIRDSRMAPYRNMSTDSTTPSGGDDGAGGGGGASDGLNEKAAAELRQKMAGGGIGGEETSPSSVPGRGQRSGPMKRTAAEAFGGVGGTSEKKDEEDEDAEDSVRLWETGWKDRYYKSKFDVDPEDTTFRYKVANHYVRGLCWVLRYYYQGCPSWKWYFPYHYAPFASDFVNIGDLENSFEIDTKPFKPLEQLMGVFPAASRNFLPPTWQRYMTDIESPIIDVYPTDFQIDLNGKKFAWQGVALLPFVDEKRLLLALSHVYDDLTDREKFRNRLGNNYLFVGSNHSAHSFFAAAVYESGDLPADQALPINTKLTYGMGGHVWAFGKSTKPGQLYKSPLKSCPDLKENKTICVHYKDPQYSTDFIFSAKLLPTVIMPKDTLKPTDMKSNTPYRPQLGFTPTSGYRHPSQKDPSSAQRMIRHGVGGGGGGLFGGTPMPSGPYGTPPSLMATGLRPSGFSDSRIQGGGGYGGGRGYYGGGGGGGSGYGRGPNNYSSFDSQTTPYGGSPAGGYNSSCSSPNARYGGGGYRGRHYTPHHQNGGGDGYAGRGHRRNFSDGNYRGGRQY